MNKWFLAVTNTLTFILALFINYLSSSGKLDGITVGDISDQNKNLFTPPGFAFSIWGVIYTLLLIFLIYQWYIIIKKKNHELVFRIGYYFILSNLANAGWIISWVNGQLILSIIMMLILLFSLIMIVIKLDLERWNAPIQIIICVWWPFTIYFGWIILALVANLAATFINIGWDGTPISQELWTIICILLAVIIYNLLIYYRNMREAAAVGIWGIGSIAYKQWGYNQSIAITALIAVLILAMAIIIHGYLNRKNSPFQKYY